MTLLLNEKKKKIRELELELRAAGAQVDALEKTARETEGSPGKSPSVDANGREKRTEGGAEPRRGRLGRGRLGHRGRCARAGGARF